VTFNDNAQIKGGFVNRKSKMTKGKLPSFGRKAKHNEEDAMPNVDHGHNGRRRKKTLNKINEKLAARKKD
jgi:hypothetical protein